MPRLPNFVFWIGVFLLVDAAIDFLGLPFWQKLVPQMNVKKIALYETLVALVILAVYFAGRAT